MKRGELLLIICILAIAAGVRLYHIETVPGLHAAEAAQGVAIITGQASDTVFSRLQSWSIDLVGTTAMALRLPAVIAGILTVLGVYLLARRLYDNREIAALAALLTAAGFWHITLSRVGMATAMPAFWATWGFYYLYKGIETHRLWHWGLAGALLGVGVLTTPLFWAVIAAAAFAVIAWWWGMRTAFNDEKFAFARHQAWGGILAMVGILVLVILPFLSQRAVRPSDVPLAGQPLFFWGVSAFLVAGILHTLWRAWQDLRHRGYPGVPHVLLLGWFGFALWAHELVLAVPAAYLFAGVGLQWLAVWMRRWYTLRDKHVICLPFERFAGRHCVGEGTLIVALAVLALLLAVGVVDVERYFQDWSASPAVLAAFPADVHAAADDIKAMAPAIIKYVVTDEPDAVQYLSGTITTEDQQRLHVTYLNEATFLRTPVRKGVVVIKLEH